jgi:hypothetical protein
MSKYATKVTNKAVKLALVAHAKANGINVEASYEKSNTLDYVVYDDKSGDLYGISSVPFTTNNLVTVDDLFTLIEKKKALVYNLLSETDVLLTYDPSTEEITLSDSYDERVSLKVDMSELTRALQDIQGKL